MIEATAAIMIARIEPSSIGSIVPNFLKITQIACELFVVERAARLYGDRGDYIETTLRLRPHEDEFKRKR